MATIHSLAAEVLSNIFELAHDPHTPSTMCAAALVCRAWRDPAQRTLFLDIAMPVVMGEEVTGKDWNRWCHYDSTRIYPPCRIELVQPQPTPWWMDVRGARALYVSGVKTLKTGAYPTWHLPIDFLNAPELSELEHLEVHGRIFETEYGDRDQRRPADSHLVWPRKLRAIRITLSCWLQLVGRYHAPPALASLSLDITQGVSRAHMLDHTRILPPTVLNLSIILSLPLLDIDLLFPFFATAQNLHHFTFNITLGTDSEIRDLYIRNQLNPISAVLPASIKRLGFKGVGNTAGLHPLSRTPFAEMCDVFSGERLPNLTRLDFPDCKRRHLEGEVAAADLLAECDRQSIRVVCWEEFI